MDLVSPPRRPRDLAPSPAWGDARRFAPSRLPLRPPIHTTPSSPSSSSPPPLPSSPPPSPSSPPPPPSSSPPSWKIEKQEHSTSAAPVLPTAGSSGSSSSVGRLEPIEEMQVGVSVPDPSSCHRSSVGLDAQPVECLDFTSILKVVVHASPFPAPKVLDVLPQRNSIVEEARPNSEDGEIEPEPSQLERVPTPRALPALSMSELLASAAGYRQLPADLRTTALYDAAPLENTVGGEMEPRHSSSLWRAGVEAGRALGTMATTQSCRLSPPRQAGLLQQEHLLEHLSESFNGTLRSTGFFDDRNSLAMLFVDFTGKNIDAFRPKYHEAAEQYKGKNIKFVLGNLDGFEGLYLEHAFPPLLVPLCSQNKDVRETALNCIEVLQNLLMHFMASRSKNGNDTISSGSISSSTLCDFLDCVLGQRKLILSDVNFLPSYLASLLSSSVRGLLVPESTKKRVEHPINDRILNFILTSAVKFSSYGKLVVLSLLKGTRNNILLVEGVKSLLCELSERRNQHLLGLVEPRERLSITDIKILCLLLEVAVSGSIQLQFDTDCLIKVLKVDGPTLDDQALVLPCITILQNMTHAFYDSLNAERQVTWET